MQIEVKDITKEFNKGLPTHIKVLDGISATFNEGEMISIIGPTGSGKTTFIEHLNALLIPNSGTINFFDVPLKQKLKKPKKPKRDPAMSELDYRDLLNVWKDKINHIKKLKRADRFEIVKTEINIKKTKRKIKNVKGLRKQVGVVFQFAEYQLFESTIEKDIIFGPISMGVKKEEAKKLARKYLKMVDLPEEYLDKSPFNLSGGQKRRVALAGILAMEPRFLVLDEPTAGLDPHGVQEMLKLFYELNRKENKTIILVTHDLDNALRWTNRTIFVKNGKIIHDGDTYEALNDEKFLIENNLIPTKLLSFVNKLKEHGFKIDKITSIDDLASQLNEQLKKKRR
ncbi:ABC transporter ATP-binding protein [Metamycoplasma arthritidis]|uniref:Cobalt ABC transporter ATP-binding protein n=1 Tax=Metamycoplasma arthritidis (strain 158L3-1) TaxID=243272 RepID=B3PMJ2_META1|nr:ATP-binding cassette domain-containing protein [Metamycoplasma arthritidis]ACF07244.1 cobalt ABC transporter ATP-binding protein [Metamycoplasma arthritidis 158L3-1]VEU78768.1 ABC transporter ATP-binding protein [Metamycoplasma arthritidis]